MENGECKKCDARLDSECLSHQLSKKKDCSDSCKKVPKFDFMCQKIPRDGLIIWAEGAPLGSLPSLELTQYYRGMAYFFCKQVLPSNRLQLRVENPYIDGPLPATPENSQMNIYYPSKNSPVYKDLLKNLNKNIEVQFMPWTHEQWIAFKYEVDNSDEYSSFKNISSGNCTGGNFMFKYIQI